MSEQEKQFHFRVDPAGLTRILRDIVLEGNWEGAMRVLEDVRGPSHQHMIDLLAGRLMIVQEGGEMSLEPDSSESADEMRQGIHELYSEWLDDSGKRTLLDERAPHAGRQGRIWRMENSGPSSSLPWSSMSQDHLHGDLGMICMERDVKQVMGMIMLQSSEPQRARASLLQITHEGKRYEHWAVFLPEQRPSTPSWQPDAIPASEAQWWERHLKLPIGSVEHALSNDAFARRMQQHLPKAQQESGPVKTGPDHGLDFDQEWINEPGNEV